MDFFYNFTKHVHSIKKDVLLPWKGRFLHGLFTDAVWFGILGKKSSIAYMSKLSIIPLGDTYNANNITNMRNKLHLLPFHLLLDFFINAFYIKTCGMRAVVFVVRAVCFHQVSCFISLFLLVCCFCPCVASPKQIDSSRLHFAHLPKLIQCLLCRKKVIYFIFKSYINFKIPYNL